MEFYSSADEEQDLAEWLAGRSDLVAGDGDLADAAPSSPTPRSSTSPDRRRRRQLMHPRSSARVPEPSGARAAWLITVCHFADLPP